MCTLRPVCAHLSQISPSVPFRLGCPEFADLPGLLGKLNVSFDAPPFEKIAKEKSDSVARGRLFGVLYFSKEKQLNVSTPTYH